MWYLASSCTEYIVSPGLARRGSETMAGSRWLLLHLAYVLPPRIRFWRIVKKIRLSKRATNTHKHGRGSYLSVGIGGDSQSLVEREPSRSKDRGLLSYNIDVWLQFGIRTDKYQTWRSTHIAHSPDVFRIYVANHLYAVRYELWMHPWRNNLL